MTISVSKAVPSVVVFCAYFHMSVKPTPAQVMAVTTAFTNWNASLVGQKFAPPMNAFMAKVLGKKGFRIQVKVTEQNDEYHLCVELISALSTEEDGAYLFAARAIGHDNSFSWFIDCYMQTMARGISSAAKLRSGQSVFWSSHSEEEQAA
ncbi:MAG: hypothetical protein WAX89_02005 [Alphaproteobacteria bacterium]